MMTRREFDQEKADFDNVTHNGAASDYWNFLAMYPAGYFYTTALPQY